MEYQPKTDEELELESLFPDGVYDAEVLEADESQDKKGREMFKLKLDVFGKLPEDGSRHVYEYISPHWMHHKFKHFFVSADVLDMYNSGTVEDAALIGKQVKVVLGSQKQEGYPPKNVVLDYVTGEKVAAGDNPPPQDDDDIPF